MPSRIVALTVALLLVVATPAAAAGRDRKAPKVAFDTQSGEVLVGAPAETDTTTVRGRARDRRSGVDRVRVVYCSGARSDEHGWTCGGVGVGPSPIITAVDATLDCKRRSRRCTWTAPVPTEPGRYLVFAEALDRAGNTSSAGPIEIVVV